MKNEWLINPQDIQIQGLLDRYMRSTIPHENTAAKAEHLDEDSLSAFVEGNLREREAQPIVAHLVECSFCRHVTAELVKLDYAFAEEGIQTIADNNQPSKISEVLSNLLSRIFGVNDGAVFAHEEKSESDKDTEKRNEPEK